MMNQAGKNTGSAINNADGQSGIIGTTSSTGSISGLAVPKYIPRRQRPRTGEMPILVTPPAVTDLKVPKYGRRQDRPPTGEIQVFNRESTAIPKSEALTEKHHQGDDLVDQLVSQEFSSTQLDNWTEEKPSKFSFYKTGLGDRSKSETKPPCQLEVSSKNKSSSAEDARQKVMSSPTNPARYSARVARKTKVSRLRKVLSYWPIVIAVCLLCGLGFIGYEIYDRYFKQSKPITTKLNVTGEFGAQPVLTMDGQLPYTLTKTEIKIAGQGAEVQEGSDVFLRVSTWDGRNGQMLCENGEPRQIIGKLKVPEVSKDLVDIVAGKKEGTRILVKRPATTQNGTTRMEVNVVDIMPTRMGIDQGQFNFKDFVFQNQGGVPSYQANTGSEIAAPESQVIIQGKGEQLSSDKLMVAQYGIWNFPDGSTKNNPTWGTSGPKAVKLDDINQALKNQLFDIRVGSRIAVFLPAAQASGGTAELIVLDILGVEKTLSPTKAEKSGKNK